MAGERSFISTPGRLQIALAASYITISDRCRRELSRNFIDTQAKTTRKSGACSNVCTPGRSLPNKESGLGGNFPGTLLPLRLARSVHRFHASEAGVVRHSKQKVGR